MYINKCNKLPIYYLEGLDVLKVDAGDQGTFEIGTDVGEFPFDKRLGEDVLLLPFKTISLIKVSMGVLPTNLKKKTCSMTCEDTVLSEGNRKRSLPNRVGWLGYWVRQYSSNAHCDFSCNCSMACALLNPIASTIYKNKYVTEISL